MDHVVLGCSSAETDITTSVKEPICGVRLGAAAVDLCVGEGRAFDGFAVPLQ